MPDPSDEERPLLEQVIAAVQEIDLALFEAEAPAERRAAWLDRHAPLLVRWSTVLAEALDALEADQVAEDLERHTQLLHAALADAAQQTSVFRMALGQPEPFHGYDQVGQALELLRRDAGMSQANIAETLQVSQSYISHVEGHRRDRRVPLEMVAEWARACERELLLSFAPRGGSRTATKIAGLLTRATPAELEVVERMIRGLVEGREAAPKV